MDSTETLARARALGYQLHETSPTHWVWRNSEGRELAAFADWRGAIGWMGKRLCGHTTPQ